jgi:hypothetical protein
LNGLAALGGAIVRSSTQIGGGAIGKNLILAGLLVALLPAVAMAQNTFDGTWKIDLSTAQMPTKPFVWLLQNGVYQCESCVPTIEVKADGQDQHVTGQLYDTISVKVLDDNTVEEIEKKNGQTVSTEKFTVSHDGNTVTDEYPNGSKGNGEPVTTKVIMTRIAKGPVGSHAVSGSWRTLKMENVADELLLITFKVQGDSLEMSRPMGQSYSAKLDGTDALYKGDPHINGVSAKRISKNTIEETDKHDGKVLSITRMTVASDGKTMIIISNDVVAGEASRYTAQKQ